MGRRAKKRSSASIREAQEAERELQERYVALGLDSPPSSPNRPVVRPEKPSASNKYIKDGDFRTLLEYVVKSAMRDFGLMDYKPPANLEVGKHFLYPDFVKVFKITVAQADIWFPYWLEFFRMKYCKAAKDRESYLTIVFKGLRAIYDRPRPFFENLMAGHAFVFCATVYFCYNGWQEALKHPFRILCTHFESHLRNPFYRAGGFRGLAAFCEGHEMLRIYEMHFEPREDASSNLAVLEKDIKARAKTEIGNLMDDIEKALNQRPEGEDPDTLLQVLAWVHHGDLDSMPKRIIGNEWKYKDPSLATILLASMVRKTPREQETEREIETVEEIQRRPSLIDSKTLQSLRKLLVEFTGMIFDLDRLAENMLE